MKNTNKAIKKHNKKVNKAFKKAEKGKKINLTELMISKEKTNREAGNSSC